MGDRGNLMVPSMIGDYEGIPDGYANPTSAIMSVAMMLLFSGRLPGAKSVIEALGRTYGEGCRTPDVGGDMTTAEFAERFYRNL
jgi:isocitrate/isopropylmalate dehydrogenase